MARDRLISTVDVEARHGHKSRAPSFDGYKSHFGVDPDDELITNVAVTAANTAHREVIDELLDQPTGAPAADTGEDSGSDSQGGPESKGFEVYGDSAYADGATLDEQAARVMTCAPRCPRCATRTAIPKISSALIWPPARSPARLATP